MRIMSAVRESDTERWIRFKKGNDHSFSAIYAEYSGKLYLYGQKFTKQAAIIEDCIQELFMELYKNRKTIGMTDNILRYLMKSYRRKILRHLKRELRYEKNQIKEEIPFEVSYSVEHDLILKEESDQRTKMYLTALQSLSPRQKEAIYLRYTKELEYEDISEIMEISVESCRNLISKAVSTLKEFMQNNYSDNII